MRDLTKEPQAAPVWRLWRQLSQLRLWWLWWLWRQWRQWRRLALACALAGLMAAPPCAAGPTIVALPDGRQFGAAGDVAYVLGMPLDATVGSRWQVHAPPGADAQDRRGGEALPRLPADVPTQNLGTVELMSGPAGPDGIAVVTVVSAVREVMPGSVLVPLPAGRSDVESTFEVE